MILWRTSNDSELNTVETYSAYSLTAGLLLLWYLAGLLTEPGHSKILDAAAYVFLFGAGPILVWLAAYGIERLPQATARMQCVIAAQSILGLMITGMVWLSPEHLDFAWYLPAYIHAFIFGLLLTSHRLITQHIERAGNFSDRIIRITVPLLPALVFTDVLLFSPDMRESLLRFLHSRSFVIGLAGGSMLAISALWALRRQHFASGSIQLNTIGRLAAMFAGVAAIVMLADTRLPFDWIHYGTYVGPASAVLEGRFPMVDTLSQYGILNYLLYSLGFAFAPYRTFTVAAGVSVLVNLATYACILILAQRLWGIRWFVLVFGLLAIYVAAHLAPFQVNSYPNFRGMRFFPAVLIAMAIVYLPADRRFTPLSIFAYCVSLLWSVEGAACAIAAYATYLIVMESTIADRFRSITRLAALTIAIYLALILGTFAVTGEPPRFDLYLKFVFGFVSVANYSGANWLKSMDPRELIWVPLALLYFGIAAISWRLVLSRQSDAFYDRVFTARLAAVAVCAVLLLSLFVFRSLLVYLLIVAPLGVILFFALTVSVWRNASASQFSRLTLGLPFVMLVGLLTAILGNALKEKDPAKIITHDVSAAHDWIRNRNAGFSDAIRRLKDPETDYATGMSFPWKPDRMREGEALVSRWFKDKNNLLIFVSESPAILLRTQKDHRYPTAYPFSEGASPVIADHIAAANVQIKEGEMMIVSNHPYELTPLETRILRHILNGWDALPIETGQYSTVYQLTRKSEKPHNNRLRLPLPIQSATESSAMSPLYSGASVSDSWEASYWSTLPGKTVTSEWVQIDLGEQKSLSRIELLPYWPAFDAFPSQFDVLVSSDNISWIKIAGEKNFYPAWSDYQTRPTTGYRIETTSLKARWIRIEAKVPYSKSQAAHVLQIADVLAFESPSR